MKPCSRYRKLIGLLAIGGLDAGEEHRVQIHLKTCGPCRAYYEDMSHLSRRLEAVELRTEIETSDSFQKSLMSRLHAGSRKRPVWSWPAAWRPTGLSAWRVAFPIGAAVLLLVAALPALLRRPNIVPSAASGAPSQSIAAGQKDLPTIAGYQWIANQSPDALDELLVKQGNRNPPEIPTPAPGLMD